jgi:catechol 2,3-dioxygenase-like lactoylglutathione lyase family enzyme
MTRALATVALLVTDYDPAVDFFTRVLRFQLVEDSPLSPGKRWVVVAPPGGQGASLLLARAVNERQRALVGDQFGGRVGLFLQCDDFWAEHRTLQAQGVVFAERPRQEAYGTVAVFTDLYGNRWDLIGPTPTPTPTPTPSSV